MKYVCTNSNFFSDYVGKEKLVCLDGNLDKPYKIDSADVVLNDGTLDLWLLPPDFDGVCESEEFYNAVINRTFSPCGLARQEFFGIVREPCEFIADFETLEVIAYIWHSAVCDYGMDEMLACID